MPRAPLGSATIAAGLTFPSSARPGSVFPLFFIDFDTIFSDFRCFFRRIRRAANKQKLEIWRALRPGGPSQKKFLESINHISFAPRDSDNR